MIRYVAPAALVRLVASVLAILAFGQPAAAADRALVNLIGYSADGAYFAFEQYGIQDGSGFAYSEVFVVDLVNDKWVSGTPVQVQAKDEAASLSAIRSTAMGKAKPLIEKYGIDVPVQILALIGDGEASATGTRVNWSTPACCGPQSVQPDAFTLLLSTRGASSPEPFCQDMAPVGFDLTYQDREGQRQLHTDADVLPRSRGCTLDYRLYAVVQPYQDDYRDGFTPRRVAIIASYPFGFEGVDRRFMIVPVDR